MESEKLKKTTGKHKKKGHHRIGFWLAVLTGTLVVLGMIILTLLPYAMEWGAERVLVRFGAESANISDIDFNPMTGHLNVFDLQVQGPNGDRLTMEQLDVRADLFPILKKRIRFREISLTGFAMDIRQHENGSILFAGLSVPEPEAAKETEPEGEDGGKPWGLGLGKLDVKEFSIHLVTPDLDETVVLNHFNLNDFETWTPDKHGDHVLRVDLLGGTIDVEGTVRPFTDPVAVSTRIGLRELSLESVMPYLKDTPVESLSGSLSGRGQIEATLSLDSSPAVSGTVRFDIFSTDSDIHIVKEGFDLKMQPGAVNFGFSVASRMDLGDSPSREAKFTVTTALEKSATELATSGTAIGIAQDTFAAKVSGSYSDTGTVDPSRLAAQAGMSMSGFVLKDVNTAAELVRLGSFGLEGIEILGPDEIGTSLARLGDITLFPRQPESVRKGEPEQALLLKSLEVSGVSLLDGSRLAVEEVRLDSFNAWVLREKEGELEVLKELKGVMPETQEPVEDDAQETTEEIETVAKKDLDVDLKKFTLTGENTLVFRDLDVTPAFNFVVDSMSASILNVSTGGKGPPTEITISTGMGKYSSVSVNGTAQPPWDHPNVDMRTKLKAIDLPALTPYTTRYLGYILRSGSLDTDVKILVEKGTLDSEADIVVNRIDLDAVKEEDEQRAEDRLGIPVKTALSLLKDKNDDIKLTLPVKGDLEDPEFKISDVIASATGLALKKGVTAYYQDLGATLLTGGLIPPGTFGILGKLFSGVTTMTFDPVAFDPLVQELSVPGKAHLDLMAEKLADKPDIRLVLCGKVTSEDIAALRQADFEEAMAAAAAAAAAGTPGAPTDAAATDPAGGNLPIEPTESPPQSAVGSTAAPVPTGPASIEEVPLNDDEKERLIEIAKQRALAVKDYLAEIGGLAPERMFVCYSEVETKGKELPPRVDLSI